MSDLWDSYVTTEQLQEIFKPKKRSILHGEWLKHAHKEDIRKKEMQELEKRLEDYEIEHVRANKIRPLDLERES